jgi:hypothetical protein
MEQVGQNVTASSSTSGGRNQAGASNTDALAFGGSPFTTEIELWNGTLGQNLMILTQQDTEELLLEVLLLLYFWR